MLPTACRTRSSRRPLAALAATVCAILTGPALLSGTPAAPEDDRPRVIATFTIIGDWLEEIGGDRINLEILAPAGAEVHEWELRPDNFIALEEADIVFANGLGLEQWMSQVEATVPAGTPIVELAEAGGYRTVPIRVGDLEGQSDPHQWMDPRAAREQTKVIAERLAELDPANADYYRDNAARYRRALDALHAELAERFAAIPAERRVLITSEAAFVYFADAYGFTHDGIWGSNAEDEGTPRQMARVIDVIEEHRPAALFWESTISDGYVRSVSDDTGTPVVGPLYTDSIGKAGSGAESYLEMMRSNADLLVTTLAERDTD